MYSSTTVLAVLGLATFASSHMIMNTPVPFGKSSLNNSPLDSTGADFPCKQRNGVYNAEGASNTMPLGSTQSLAFTGSATHGGGSCQVSITYDKAPTKSSTWKVIHSIVGGCPIRNTDGNLGNDPNLRDPNNTYSFTIPTTLPTGTAVLAWTWFNKVGNREMYMNCAPVSLTASSSKRSEDEFMDGNYTMLMERDMSAYNSLPDMFTANIGNGCGTADGKDLLFPNPGDSVEKNPNPTATPVAPTGSCKAAAAGNAPPVGSSIAGSAPTTSAPAQSSPSSIAGGVFVTVSPSAGSPPMTTASAAASSVTVAPSSIAPVESSIPVMSTPVASSSTPANTGTGTGTAGTGTTGSGSAMAAGTACTSEGEWNCIGGTSYQRCASGAWSVVQQLAAGTSCTPGQTTNINIVARGQNKRSVRFSGQHLRRHLQKS